MPAWRPLRSTKLQPSVTVLSSSCPFNVQCISSRQTYPSLFAATPEFNFQEMLKCTTKRDKRVEETENTKVGWYEQAGMPSTTNRADKWASDRLWAQGQRVRACRCLRWAGSLISYSFNRVIYSYQKLVQTHTQGGRETQKRDLDSEAQPQSMRDLDSAPINHWMGVMLNGNEQKSVGWIQKNRRTLLQYW